MTMKEICDEHLADVEWDRRTIRDPVYIDLLAAPLVTVSISYGIRMRAEYVNMLEDI